MKNSINPDTLIRVASGGLLLSVLLLDSTNLRYIGLLGMIPLIAPFTGIGQINSAVYVKEDRIPKGKIVPKP